MLDITKLAELLEAGMVPGIDKKKAKELSGFVKNRYTEIEDLQHKEFLGFCKNMKKENGDEPLNLAVAFELFMIRRMAVMQATIEWILMFRILDGDEKAITYDDLAKSPLASRDNFLQPLGD
jgi:hypothetical protein|tara:strand:+ start:13439 stop:13804 length:366 start_codon:yes stop_codon:yes gene_type:complete